MKIPYYDAIRMAAWANDEQLQDTIAQQAIEHYQRTNSKITCVTLADNARLKRAKRIFDAKVQQLHLV